MSSFSVCMLFLSFLGIVVMVVSGDLILECLNSLLRWLVRRSLSRFIGIRRSWMRCLELRVSFWFVLRLMIRV